MLTGVNLNLDFHLETSRPPFYTILKLVEKVSKFLGVVEYYQSLRKSQPSRAFFYNSDADAIDHASSISYIIIDHTEFSSKQHQRKIRKSVGHFLQTVTKIESTEYEVLEDFTSADNKQVQSIMIIKVLII